MKKKFISAAIAASMVVSLFASAGAVPASAEGNYDLPAHSADGVILHCFDWSFNSIKDNLQEIAAAGYKTIQTSPVQQPKDYGEWLNGEGQWWKLYQPLSFQIAQDKSWLGTKDELAALCAEADKYGINVICDIVANHMANQSGNTYLTVFHDIKNYEPEIYKQKADTFHQLKKGIDDSRIEWLLQGEMNYLPDLNTSNELVQSRVISLLKECIDCGVDGFRFDAAKHIETPEDGEYASDFWPNVTQAANDYAASKGRELYMYGEILNSPGKGRSTTYYTKYIDVIDNKMGNGTLAYITKKKASMVEKAQQYSYDYEDPSNLVVWAESHDTFMDGSSKGATNDNIVKTWALVASRAKSHALYFARPNDLMGLAGDTTWKSTAVSEINKFHNKFIGTDERVFSDGDVVGVQRGDNGMVLVNLGDSAAVSCTSKNMKDGAYKDAVSGSTFTVSGSKEYVFGDINSDGTIASDDALAVLRQATGFDEGFTDTQTTQADVDEDGTLTANDSLKVLRKSVDLSDTGTCGEKFLADGVLRGTVGESGVAVIYENAETTPHIDLTPETTSFRRNTLRVEAAVQNADSATYSINGGAPVSFNGSQSFLIGDGVAEGNSINVKVTATKNGKTVEFDQDYYKSESDHTGTFVYFDNSETSYKNVYAYGFYDSLDDQGRKINIAKDVQWPGIKMEFDEEKGLYAYEVPSSVPIGKGSVIINNGIGWETKELPIETTESIYDNSKGALVPMDGSEPPVKTDTDTDKTTEPVSGNKFYIINSAGWIFDSGCKMWVINNETGETIETVKPDDMDDKAKYSSCDLPETWKSISICRTPWNLSVEEAKDDPAYETWNCGTIPDGKNGVQVRGHGDNNIKYKAYTP